MRTFQIVRRLSFDLQSRWLRISAGVEPEGREPNFADLKRFIVNEADVVKSSYANSLNCKSKPGSVFGVNTHYSIPLPQIPLKLLTLMNVNFAVP